ncbi:MAG: AAA domain-containing protein [Candidatus Methanoperedens sp.]|nr:AAA domain-containing protein [Candidatus Methanoperedens sp.]
MVDIESNSDSSATGIENYIEFINIQLKNPNTRDIPISNGTFTEFWNEYPIYNFEISVGSVKKLENLHGDYWIEISGQRKECNLVDLSERQVSIWIKEKNLDTKNTIRNASIKVDLSFILKRQLAALEQLQKNRYETVRNYLFAAEDIPNSCYANCSFENCELNEEQKDAIRFAVGVKDFYLIWGPPGTGKTTVIPEVVINYSRNYLKEKNKEPRILVCSWTNAAVDTVAKRLFGKIEKMVRYGDTSLRKKEYRDKYKSILFEEQVKSKKIELEVEINKKSSILENEKTSLEAEIKQIEMQFKNSKEKRELISQKIGSLDNEIAVLKKKKLQEERVFISLYKRIFQHSDWIKKNTELQSQLGKLLSQKNELSKEIKNMEQSTSNLKLNITKCQENLKITKTRFNKLHEDKNVAFKNIEAKVLNENLAILTTNIQTANSIFENINFDLVIMDEAGAIDLPSAAIVLTRSSKVVFLGDHKQLPPIIQENSSEIKSFLRKHPKIKRSIFEILYKKYYKKDCLIMLENQYRMKKKIADFISNQFYDGRIKSPSEIHGILKNTNDAILSAENPVVLFKRNFKTEFEGKSSYNIPEIIFIKNIISKFEHEYGKEIRNKISIVTPYRAQREHLTEELPDVDCGTVHTYQGQEKEIVIFSTVKYRKGINGFGPLFDGSNGDNLFNVAMSRAKEKFIIIGGYALFKNVKTYNELYKYTENCGLIIKEPIDGYDGDTINKCPMCGERTKPSKIRCSDCEQLYIMQTMQEQIPRSKKCVDGDLVRSIGEVLIDNWLHSNNIKHQVEQKVPILKLMYCDWYLPDYDTYIEFWGDIHTKSPEKRRVKERLYQENKLKLVGIEVIDTDNLDEILKYKLKLKNGS